MPGKRAARPPRRQRGLKVLTAVVVGVLLTVVVVWFAFARLGGKSNDTADHPSSSATSAEQPSRSPSPTATSKASAGSSATPPPALRTCATTVRQADTVVAAASQGVEDWNIHVQSRTDMLQGRMSVSTMDAMWKRTRLAGPADQRRFHAALDSYHPTSACTELRNLPKVDKSSASHCATRYAAASEAVDAAKAAMADWKSHLDNMAAFAAGKMTPAEAQTRWVEAWRNAPPHIDDYERARRALDKAPACTLG
jgi:hypothetical protein